MKYVHVCPISLHKEITFSTYSLTGSDVGIDHGWNHAYTMNLIQMDVVIAITITRPTYDIGLPVQIIPELEFIL